MRKIEQNMLQAVLNCRDWHEDNTSVIGGAVYLHGNRIAYRDTLTRLWVADAATLAQWPTNTTRSRLRALGFTVKGSSVTGPNPKLNGSI